MYVYYINVCYIHFLDLYIERTIGNELSSVDRYCDDTDAPFPLKSAGRWHYFFFFFGAKTCEAKLCRGFVLKVMAARLVCRLQPNTNSIVAMSVSHHNTEATNTG